MNGQERLRAMVVHFCDQIAATHPRLAEEMGRRLREHLDCEWDRSWTPPDPVRCMDHRAVILPAIDDAVRLGVRAWGQE